MDFEKCVPALSEALGKRFNKDEVEALIKQVRDRSQRKSRDNQFLSLTEAVMKAAGEIKDEKLLSEARIERDAFNRGIAWKAATAELDRLKADFDAITKDAVGHRWQGYADALRTYFFGRVGPVEGSAAGLFDRTANIAQGAADHFAAAQERIAREHGYSTSVTSGSVKRMLQDPDVDRRVSLGVGYLFNGVKPDEVRVDGKPLARVELELAQNIHTSLNEVRAYANDRGALIGHADHYMGRMVHDQDAILKAGMYQWIAKAKTWLHPDVVEQIGDKGLEQAWRNLTTGMHHGVAAMDVEAFYGKFESSARLTPDMRNLVGKLSAEKTFLFRDPESAYAYRQEFGGSQSIFEIIPNQIRRTMQDAEFIRALGPTPEVMARDLIQYAHDRIGLASSKATTDAEREAFAKQSGTINSSTLIKNIESSLRGDRFATQNRVWANVDTAARNIMTGLRLGWGAVRQLPIDSITHGLSHRTGELGAIEQVAGGLHSFFKVLPDADREEIMYALHASGVHNGMELARMGLDQADLTSSTGRFAQFMMTVSGQAREQRTMYQRGVFEANHQIAYFGAIKDVKYTDLPDLMRTKLTKGGIDERMYDFARANLIDDRFGAKWVNPEKVRAMYEVDDPALKAFLGEDMNDRQYHIASQDLANTLRGYAIEQSRAGMNEPTEAMNIWKSFGNSQRGSFKAIIANNLAQFHTYTASQLVRQLGRELYDGGKVNWSGVGQYVVGTALGGYMTLCLEAWLVGKTAPVLSNPNTWVNAFAMGGMLGPITDAMQNPNQNNMDRVSRVLDAPVASIANDAYNVLAALWHDHADSTAHGAPQTGKTLARDFFSYVPGFNLWWTRGITDMVIRDAIMEKFSPGYYARQARTLAQQGQRYFVEPNLTPPF